MGDRLWLEGDRSDIVKRSLRSGRRRSDVPITSISVVTTVRTPSSLKLASYSVCACARAFPRASLVPVVPFLVATLGRDLLLRQQPSLRLSPQNFLPSRLLTRHTFPTLRNPNLTVLNHPTPGIPLIKLTSTEEELIDHQTGLIATTNLALTLPNHSRSEPNANPPPRFGRISNPSSSRASPALSAPTPRRPVDTDIVISAVGQALIPTRAESVPEPLELEPIESIEFPGASRRHEPIRIDTPPNPPIQPNPAMATGQDVLNALNTLATNQTALQQVVTDLVTNMNSSKGVSKPHNYNGIGSEDARRFLAAFEVWAQGIPRIRTLTGHKPVKSAISFLEGEAAIWATPIAENISAHTSNNNIALTYPNWVDFKAAFIARFETADPVTDAKTMLKTLYQGKNSVASYAATFKQYSGRTGYSDVDLRDKFYDHLADRIKDGLVHTQANTSLLASLIAEAIRVDNRINERNRQKTPFKAVTPSAHHFQPGNPPFFPPRDPNAMDVDATRTVTGKSSDDYRRFMMGRCYGCGSKNHRKADGHHERDV
ncbi:hypothetical protein D9757_014592 [Collybiopsis confluens]|uniref:Retrotransposon gag domain-containing protein n=1 Tax=Collybiopsis confluens TaxID=2823264 RepID=A0A8H5G0G3_9AGAR|nr:hypothetical protein D9757_014592 [Collybiopsis confluens]